MLHNPAVRHGIPSPDGEDINELMNSAEQGESEVGTQEATIGEKLQYLEQPHPLCGIMQ